MLLAWNKITVDWPSLSSLEIPRCLQRIQDHSSVVQLHIFCDASMDAKGVASYLRVTTTNSIDVSFIASKSAVAKLTRETIPHAELQAATMGAREMLKLRKAFRLQIDAVFFWVDSEAVLYWLRTPATRKNPHYVAPCRDFILSCTAPESWHYVPSELNPADDITRGVSAKAISATHRFFKPQFLEMQEQYWPTQPSKIPTGIFPTNELVVSKANAGSDTFPMIKAADTLANLKKTIADDAAGNCLERSVMELHRALIKCIIDVQSSFFRTEIKDLRVNFLQN